VFAKVEADFCRLPDSPVRSRIRHDLQTERWGEGEEADTGAIDGNRNQDGNDWGREASSDRDRDGSPFVHDEEARPSPVTFFRNHIVMPVNFEIYHVYKHFSLLLVQHRSKSRHLKMLLRIFQRNPCFLNVLCLALSTTNTHKYGTVTYWCALRAFDACMLTYWSILRVCGTFVLE